MLKTDPLFSSKNDPLCLCVDYTASVDKSSGLCPGSPFFAGFLVGSAGSAGGSMAAVATVSGVVSSMISEVTAGSFGGRAAFEREAANGS